LFQLAAAQGLDEAQWNLGRLKEVGFGMAKDEAEALHLFQLAADQGFPGALFYVAGYHEEGKGGLRKNKVEAIRWYSRAKEAGVCNAKHKLLELGA
jgi:TPR repeat protein